MRLPMHLPTRLPMHLPLGVLAELAACSHEGRWCRASTANLRRAGLSAALG